MPGGYAVSDVSLAGLLHFVGLGLIGAAFVVLAYRTAGIVFRTCFGFLVLVGSLRPRQAASSPMSPLVEPVITARDTVGGNGPGTVLMSAEPPSEPGIRH